MDVAVPLGDGEIRVTALPGQRRSEFRPSPTHVPKEGTPKSHPAVDERLPRYEQIAISAVREFVSAIHSGEIALDYKDVDKLKALAHAYQELELELGTMQAQLEASREDLANAERENAVLRQRLTQYEKQIIVRGNVGTLQEELDEFLADYMCRKISENRRKGVRRTLRKFVHDLGPNRNVRGIGEDEINRYIQHLRKRLRPSQKVGDAISEVRRNEVRIYVCMFLESATHGAFDRKKVETIKRERIKRERGPIIWLERAEAERLLRRIYKDHGPYWGDLARLQLDMGWRSEELVILQKQYVNGKVVTLESVRTESGAMMAKTGRRTVQVPKSAREAVDRRMAANGKLLFPHLGKGKRLKDQPLPDMWTPVYFVARYREVLADAAKSIRLAKPTGCRLLRRTFGSLMLRAGRSPYEVAVLMGNSEKIVREHYAALLAEEISTEL